MNYAEKVLSEISEYRCLPKGMLGMTAEMMLARYHSEDMTVYDIIK